MHRSNKRGVKRKYDENFLSYGFTWTGSKDYPDALCVIYQKVLENSSLVPTKMKRYFQSNHLTLVGKNTSFFAAKLRILKDMQKFMHSTTMSTEKLLEISYLISQKIAMSGEAHTIAENLIKSCILKAAKVLLCDNDYIKLESIPLSNSTIGRRIDDMGMYIKSELCSSLQQFEFFCLQIDESTDVAGLAVLLAFVRYVYNAGIQDLLLSKTLPTFTIEEIFKILNSFMNENAISWNKCMDICTDGAKSMTGSIKGVVS